VVGVLVGDDHMADVRPGATGGRDGVADLPLASLQPRVDDRCLPAAHQHVRRHDAERHALPHERVTVGGRLAAGRRGSVVAARRRRCVVIAAARHTGSEDGQRHGPLAELPEEQPPVQVVDSRHGSRLIARHGDPGVDDPRRNPG
jgi:hypothetical protein